MESWILKLLNIRKEEQKPVYLLMLFSFFIGLSLTFYFTAANAIFLKHFKPSMIPLSYVASGVMVYLTWWSLSRLDRLMALQKQIVVKILFVFLSVLVIGTGVWRFDSPWLAFLLFTWIRVMVYVTVVTFWGFAGKLFNIRQGKRIFGLIGIGEVLSIIIGYFSVPLLLAFLTVADLLFLASATLLGCLIIVLIILRQFRSYPGLSGPPPAHAKKTRTSEWNYWKLLKQPYFLLISLMALLPIFGYLSVDFLFLAQTKREFANNPETIARFLGIFLGFTAVVELAFKLVSGRFLTRYGLKPSLVSLPAILLFGVLMATVMGALHGQTGLFFAFIAFSRLFERAVRGSVYEPAFQLLYQPVPEDKRLIFQNQIEGIPKALGTIITGGIIYALSLIPAFQLTQFNLVFLLVLALWIWLGSRMYESYRGFIRKKLDGMSAEASGEVHTQQAVMEQRLLVTPPGRLEAVFEVYDHLAPFQAGKALERVLPVAPEPLQEEILRMVKRKRLYVFHDAISRICNAGELPRMRKQMEEIAAMLNRDSVVPPEELATPARSENPAERKEVAAQLGNSLRYNAYRLLLNLLKDPDPDVRKTALISAGRLRRPELQAAIIDHLTNETFSSTAFIALKMIGAPVIADVDREFDKLAASPQTRIRIIQLFEEIGGEKAIRCLRSRISHPDRDVQVQVLLSLRNLGYRASVSERPFIRQAIREVVDSIVYIMASLTDISGADHNITVQNALLQEMEERKENIFLLLSLIYEAQTIRHIRESIESQDPRARIYALEILDMTVSDEIKEIFLPLFEDISIRDRLQRFNIHFPQEQLPAGERLLDIVQQDFTRINNWTKACAIELLGRLYLSGAGDPTPELERVGTVLAGCLVHPDPLIGETAALALRQIDPDRFQVSCQLLGLPLAGTLPDLSETRFGIVLELKELEWLSPVPEYLLVPLASRVQQTGAKEVPYALALDFIQGNSLLTERFLDHLTHENG